MVLRVGLTVPCLFLLLAAGYAPQAQALRVKNADDVAYRLQVTQFGRTKDVTLPPYGIYNDLSPGGAEIRLGAPGGCRVEARFDQEYMIQGGRLHLQRFYRQHGGSF